jgi:hypothetical protein
MFRPINGHFQGGGFGFIPVIYFPVGHLRVYNHPHEYAHCRSKHVAIVSYIYELLSICCFTVVGKNTVKNNTHFEKKQHKQ